MIAGTVITPAGTVMTRAGTVVFYSPVVLIDHGTVTEIHGNNIDHMRFGASRDPEIACMEYGDIGTRIVGPKKVYTVSHSSMEKKR